MIGTKHAAEILEVKNEEFSFIQKFCHNDVDSLNFFELCAGLVLLSDSTLKQKSELLIALFDTNENYIIGDNELAILGRCCIVALAVLSGSDRTLRTSQVTEAIHDLTKGTRYEREEGISVNDFTNFLLDTPAILGLLNQFGLFL